MQSEKRRKFQLSAEDPHFRDFGVAYNNVALQCISHVRLADQWKRVRFSLALGHM